MRRILTKLLAVLVPCVLVVGSIGFACMADEAEAETVDTTVETEQEQPDKQPDEQPDKQTDDAQNDKQEGEEPDSGLPPADSASDDTEAPDDKVSEETAAPEDIEQPEGADEDVPSENGEQEEYPDIDVYVPGEGFSFSKNDPSYRPAKSLASAGSGLYRYQLTGNDETVYYLLKYYFSEVAKGRRNSTIFDITFENLGVEDKYYTAADLGLDTVVVNGRITPEAMDKMGEFVGFDIQRIVDKLLVDCPFDCYWYDKTSETNSEGYMVSATYSNGEWKLYFSGTGYKYYFPVSQDYADGSYNVSSVQINRALSASNKAKQIVNKYTKLSDYEKLVKYKEEICALVNYNNAAADNSNTPFGDPWQLIYVFDGDSRTDVVCEGYSKAFKYLCDLSVFDDDVTCILVSGNFNTTNGTDGGHMWNVVSFGNGMNYLVDVTNCDDGSIGQTDKLFLKKYTTNPSSSIYKYKIGTTTCTYTYYSSMFSLYRDATLDLADDSLVMAPAIVLNSSCKGFALTWTQIPGAQYYEVYRRSALGYWQYIDSVQSNSWNDYNLEESMIYYYGIRGVDSNNKYINVINDQYYLKYVYEHNVVTDPAVEATHDHPGLTEGSHCSVCGMVIVEQQEIPMLVSTLNIVDQPSDYTGLAGTTARFTVVAEGDGLKYQWQLKKGSSWANQSSGGATTSTFSVKAEESRNGKVYRCVITDSHGMEVTTLPVTLHVKEPSIHISSQPADYSGIVGTTARFTVVAEGEGLTYQWQLKKGSSWANQSSGGATTPTFSVKAELSRNGKVYRCLITDANGEQIATTPVTLTVREPSVVIKTQPSDYTGIVGSTARFTVVAEGEGLTYQWQLKKGRSWANQSSGGATTSTFSVKAELSRNGKVYRCLITDANGEQIATVEVTLNVKEPSNAINIISQPMSYDGPAGGKAVFTVQAEGEGLTYQWQLKKGSSWANQSSGGATTDTFTVKAEESRNGKVYRCVITDSNGEMLITEEVSITISDTLPPLAA